MSSPVRKNEFMFNLDQTMAMLATVSIEEDEVDKMALTSNDNALSNYCRSHGLRLFRSLRMLQKHAPSTRPLRILELGAAPYYFTALLYHYMPDVDVTAANVKAGVWPGSEMRTEVSHVRLKWDAGGKTVSREIPIHIFNFERDPFPFSEASFDIVLCMDVIEHLAYSPSHMLAEAHRVMKPGGILVLSTPNAIDIIKTIKMLQNRSINFPYSGYGIYGRHNREYTKAELVHLTAACGYQIIDAWAENVYDNFYWWPPRQFIASVLIGCTQLPLPYLENKREYLFVVARGTCNPVVAYPEDLYYFKELYPKPSE
jgi:SAM-dependent methyltransferase